MPQSLPRPTDPETRRRAALASGEPHQVLAAAGAWLREADEERRAEAEEALAALALSDVQGALGAIDPSSCRDALAEACDEAFEAALEDDEEERDALAASAIELLERRDDVESTLVAVALVVDQAPPSSEATSIREVASSLREALSAVDAGARARSRALSAVNAERRARGAALAPAHRAAAWWWCDRADEADDGLVELLAGRPCSAGEAAQAASRRAVLAPRGDALGAALRRLDAAGRDALGADATREDPALRFAIAEASRSEAAAVALRIARELDVDVLDADG